MMMRIRWLVLVEAMQCDGEKEKLFSRRCKLESKKLATHSLRMCHFLAPLHLCGEEKKVFAILNVMGICSYKRPFSVL